MSGFVEWIWAEGDEGGGGNIAPRSERVARDDKHLDAGEERGRQSGRWKDLPKHDFGIEGQQRKSCGGTNEDVWDRDPDLWLYRKKTTSLLRRYMRWSLEAGRVPSLLGRELFRTKLTAYSATTFEARVIFLHDVEGCLERLGSFDRQIIA